MRIAVIGSGVSGILAARLLSTIHDTHLFEANEHAGGHARTVDVVVGGQTHAVDVGFMVYNQRTYPNFCRLLKLLEIDSQRSDMSFSVRCAGTGLEYQGSSLNGLFAQRINCLRPGFLKMLWDIVRFNRRGTAAVVNDPLGNGRTVGDFLRECGVGRHFTQHYLLPMASAIWSSKPNDIHNFPAQFLLGFFANHGLMQIRDRPEWRTIVGGSRNYVAALLKPLEDRVRFGCPVLAVNRSENDVTLSLSDGSQARFHEVVLACHADQALALLANPTGTEQQILESFPYQENDAVLHTDVKILPKRKCAWASWNYHIPANQHSSASVTYHLSRLQNHASTTPILLTLNATSEIDKSKIIQTFDFTHPAYSTASISAQRRHREISGQRRTHFCGAYWGYGFHEDAVNSTLAVAKHFGIGLNACTAASTKGS